MPTRRYLTIICYDISTNKRRRKVAERLEEVAVRVQYSVFEAWLTRQAADKLIDELKPKLDVDDSLRLYMLGQAGLRHMRTLGTTPVAAAQSYYLV